MSFKTTIILVVILIIVVGAMWLLSRPESVETPVEEKPGIEQTKKLFDPQPERDKVTRVEVDRPGKPRLAFERIVDEKETRGLENWRMVEPVEAPVESYLVRQLVSNIIGLESRSPLEPAQDGAPTAAEAGFEPPTATVTLTDEDGKTYAVEIGTKVLMSNDTYVRLPGETTIHVAKRDLLGTVRKEVKDYRAKKLLDVKFDEAVRVQVAQADRQYDFSRGSDGAWVINAPVRAYADQNKLRDLVTRFNGLRVQDFVDDAPAALAPYGLGDPFLTFTVTTEREEKIEPEPDPTETQPAAPEVRTITQTHQLAVGSFADLKSEKRYAKLGDQPWIVSFPASAVDGLIPNLKELRDPIVTRVKANSVTSLEITTPAGTARLTREDGVWQGQGDLAAVESTAVTDLLQAFEDLRAIDYVDSPQADAAYGLDQPRAIISATTTGSVTPVTLDIGSETASGRNAYVRRGDDPTVIVVSAAQAERLAVRLLSLRSREVFKFAPDCLRRIICERPAQTYELVRGEDSQWQLIRPADAPLNEDSARVLPLDLCRLRARTVVDVNNEDQYGLNPPLTTIRLEVADEPPKTQPAVEAPTPTTEHVLRIGRRDGVAYACKDDEPYIFELDESVYDVLIAELIDTKLFDFDPGEVTGIKIVAPGGGLEFVKVDGQWKYAPDRFVALSQTEVQKLVEAIAEFRAADYFAYRNGDLSAEGLADPPGSLTVAFKDGHKILMSMTKERPGGLPRKAALPSEGRIFRLREADCQKLLGGLDDYLKPDAVDQ